MSSFKIVLVGPAQSGKSAFVERHRTGDFPHKYVPTLGVDVYTLTFKTTGGPVTFSVWDCAGDPKYGGFRDGYYVGADGAIVFTSDQNDPTTLKGWIDEVRKTLPPQAFVVVKSKVDEVSSPHEPNLIQISSLTKLNIHLPFLTLTRKLMNDPSLNLVET